MKRSFSIICLYVLFCSCADFLSETDPNAVTTESYYINTEDVEMSVRGCYNALYEDGYFGMMYLYTEVRSDNTTWQIPGANNGVYYQFHDYTLRTDNTYLYTHYTGLYLCISRCNTVLAHIDDVAWSDSQRRAQLEAEVRFLRALSYYYLVAQWGDVPCITRTFATKDEVQAATKRDPKGADLRNHRYGPRLRADEPAGGGEQCGNGGPGLESRRRCALWQGAAHAGRRRGFRRRQRSTGGQGLRKTDLCLGNPEFRVVDGDRLRLALESRQPENCKEHIFQVNYLSGNEQLGSEYAWRFQPEATTGLNSNKAGQGHNIFEQNLIDEFEAGTNVLQPPMPTTPPRTSTTARSTSIWYAERADTAATTGSYSATPTYC